MNDSNIIDSVSSDYYDVDEDPKPIHNTEHEETSKCRNDYPPFNVVYDGGPFNRSVGQAINAFNALSNINDLINEYCFNQIQK